MSFKLVNSSQSGLAMIANIGAIVWIWQKYVIKQLVVVRVDALMDGWEKTAKLVRVSKYSWLNTFKREQSNNSLQK